MIAPNCWGVVASTGAIEHMFISMLVVRLNPSAAPQRGSAGGSRRHTTGFSLRQAQSAAATSSLEGPTVAPMTEALVTMTSFP
jgi:hypothetical protein